MGKLTKLAAAALLPFGMLAFSSSAQASAVQTTCTLDSFTLTSVTVGNPAGPNLLSQSYNSTYCVGVLENANDDAGGLSEPDPNIGIFNEGILNGEGDLFDGLEFITAADLQDIDGVGGMNDPGWIHLAHMDAENDLNPTYDSIQSLDLADILAISFNCTVGSADDCKGGTWSLNVDPVAFALVQAILGPNSFDNLALSIKSGNRFAVYDLDFDVIFGTENNPALNFTTAYNFSGTFNTGDFTNRQGNPQGISHMNLWARDPINTTTEVPEPATLAMFGLGLVGLSLGRQIKRRKA